jgi:gliding motility-associated-like protein
VGFYDQFPGVANAQKLSPSFVLDKNLLGRCNSATYTHILKAGSLKQDSLLLVFDENKTVDELNEANNNSTRKKFQYRLSVNPSDTLVYVNTSLSLQLQKNANDSILAVLWSPATNLSCTGCMSPNITVTDTVLLKAIAGSSFGCTDSANAYIKVFPIDLSADNLLAICDRNDSMQVQTKICLGNGYKSLKKQVAIEYFDGDITTGSANKLGSFFIDQNTIFPDTPGCTTIQTTIKISKTNKLFVYVNRELLLFETNTGNNLSVFNFTPFKLIIDPKEYEIYRGQSVTLTVTNQGEPYAALQWTPADEALSCSNCLVSLVTTAINRTYKIWGSTANFCTDSTTVTVKAFYQSHLALPNIFTPNGDGNNDWFYVIAGKEVSMVNQFQVFNRWGEKIFEKQHILPNDRFAGWNGYYKGRPAENGTYVYYIVLGLQDGTIEEKRGNITLVR